MKKYFALIISVIVILTCFTACKPKLKDGVLVTDAAGKGYAAVTQEGGGAARDDAGNLVVLVTDEKRPKTSRAITANTRPTPSRSTMRSSSATALNAPTTR